MMKLEKQLKTIAKEFVEPTKLFKNKWFLATAVTLTAAATEAECFLKTHPQYIPYIEAAQKYMDHLSEKLNLLNYIF